MTRPHNQPMPCGTRAAYKRGCRCEPCVQASRAYNARTRARAGIKPRNTMTTTEIIAEIEYLLHAGEGEHRIITALCYQGRHNTLKSRLYRANRHDLITKIFNTWELAA